MTVVTSELRDPSCSELFRTESVVIGSVGRLQDDGGREVVFLERRPTIGKMFGRYQAHAVGKGKVESSRECPPIERSILRPWTVIALFVFPSIFF